MLGQDVWLYVHSIGRLYHVEEYIQKASLSLMHVVFSREIAGRLGSPEKPILELRA